MAATGRSLRLVPALIFAFITLLAQSAPTDRNATLAFAKHFQDGMVLQREPAKANVYGFSPDVGANLTLEATDVVTGQVDKYTATVEQGTAPGVGTWMFTLNATAPGTVVNITVTLENSTDHQLSLSNVIFGDVWLCSGQSNMEMTVSMMIDAEKELEDAHNYPNIRFFSVAKKTSSTPLDDLLDVKLNWSKPSRATLGGPDWYYFSAVCWVYGKNLHKELGVPIGLVDANWGGSPVGSWSSPDALNKCNIKLDTEAMYPEGSFYSDLWNSMVHPFLKMTIYGAVWYQGESDSWGPMMPRYDCTFPTMIDDWRAKFHAASNGQTSEEFHFGFVQLSANNPNPNIDWGFPNARWHQTANYGTVPNKRMKNVFMAVAIDLPGFTSKFDAVHPQDKSDVGKRLALSGLNYAYNKPQKCNGPYPLSATNYGEQLIVQYHGTEELEVRSWLGFDLLCQANPNTTARTAWVQTGIVTHVGSVLKLFLNVCGKDQEVAGIRYAWRESPCAFKQCAIYGSESGLPGPPFLAFAQKQEGGKIIFKFDGPVGLYG